MFHNFLMTNLTPISDTNKTRCWDDRPFTICPEEKQEKSKEICIKKTIKKKKRNRTMFTTEQVRILEKVFARSKYIDAERRREISECLQIEQKCIKIWFQNRRMKEKKELSESCDSTSESQISSLESLSPPLKSPQPTHHKPENDHTNTVAYIDARPSQYYYNNPYNFIKTEAYQDEVKNYEASSNPIIPEYTNYIHSDIDSYLMRNNTDYSAQYYPPQAEYQYYYNTGGVHHHNNNIRDWPANMYDTSYF